MMMPSASGGTVLSPTRVWVSPHRWPYRIRRQEAEYGECSTCRTIAEETWLADESGPEYLPALPRVLLPFRMTGWMLGKDRRPTLDHGVCESHGVLYWSESISEQEYREAPRYTQWVDHSVAGPGSLPQREARSGSTLVKTVTVTVPCGGERHLIFCQLREGEKGLYARCEPVQPHSAEEVVLAQLGGRRIPCHGLPRYHILECCGRRWNTSPSSVGRLPTSITVGPGASLSNSTGKLMDGT